MSAVVEQRLLDSFSIRTDGKISFTGHARIIHEGLGCDSIANNSCCWQMTFDKVHDFIQPISEVLLMQTDKTALLLTNCKG